MDATDDALARVPLDAEYAAQCDLENLCAAWTPAEMRDAARLCIRLGALTRRYAVSCTQFIADALAFEFMVPEDYRAVFGGALQQNQQLMEVMLDSAQGSHDSTNRNLRCAGALLWLAEQREAGTS